ncbi:MAG: hypothetical protein MJY87_00775 [Fibrobacter sp.]|nr:hypothetical protein [Fibrobacter sp.]
MNKKYLLLAAPLVASMLFGCGDATNGGNEDPSNPVDIVDDPESSDSSEEPGDEIESSSSEKDESGSSEDAESSDSKDESSSSEDAESSDSKDESSSSEVKNGCGDLWCGNDKASGHEGRVLIEGQEDKTSGYWYEYNDNTPELKGNSKLFFPNDVTVGSDQNIYGAVAKEYSALKAYAEIGYKYNYAYTGVAFDIVGESKKGADISDWEGLCLAYYSGAGFSVELAPENEETTTQYNNHIASVPKASKLNVIDLPWTRFKQNTGWGKSLDIEKALKQVASIRFRFDRPGGDFALFTVGRYGTCGGTLDIPKKAYNSISNQVIHEEPSVCGDLWCGPEDAEGRVMIPGQSGDFSGYWEEYNDNDDLNGNSRLVFPKDVDTNMYGNFYGPLIEAYGGIKAYAQMGRAYMYPFAGVQFPIVDNKKTGGDISDWEGICLTYYSTNSLQIELISEDEKNYTGYNNYKVDVPKAAQVTVADFEWSRFKQESGWGNAVSREAALKKVAAVGFRFSKDGDFALLSVGRKGTCTTDAPYPPAKTFNSLASIVTPIPEGSALMNSTYATCGDLWCGKTDVKGRVNIPFTTSELSGYWYDFDDAVEGGTSKLEFPKNVNMTDEYDVRFFGNLISTYKGFTATASIGKNASNNANYAGIGFNIVDDVESSGEDIAYWKGLCMAYASDMDFRLAVIPENEPAVTSYDNYGITLNKSQSPKMVNIKWNDLEREGWGSTVVSINEVVKAAARIQYMFRKSGDFKIFTIGRYGTCDGSSFKPCSDIWCGRVDAGSPAYTGFSNSGAGRMYTYDDGDVDGNSVVTLNSAIAGTADNFVPQDEVIDYNVALGLASEFPFAGIGFSIKGDGTGGDLHDWYGICVTYEASTSFEIELVTDDESTFTQYNNFKASVPKATTKSVVNYPWTTKFRQDSGWGLTVSMDDVLRKIDQVRFKSTTSGDFKIYQIGRAGTCSVN